MPCFFLIHGKNLPPRSPAAAAAPSGPESQYDTGKGLLIAGVSLPEYKAPKAQTDNQRPENQPEKIIFFQKRLGVEALKSVHGQIIIPCRPYSTAPAIGVCFLLHQRVDDAEEMFSRLEA